MKTICYGYMRVSSEGQNEGDGFPRQERNITEFATFKGWELAGIEQDTTRGANELADRDGLLKLMERLVVTTAPRIIVVEAQHRWARDLIVGEMLLRECKKAGIQVWSASGNQNLCEDGADGTQKFIRQVMSALDEFDKHRLVHRMRVARQRRKSESNGVQGTEGRKPYGTLPGELRTLLVMTDLQRERRTMQEIAEELTEMGCLTRATKKHTARAWTSGSVWRVLNNPRSRRLVV